MTGAEHNAQRALVEASLLADEQRQHHHDVYSSRGRATTPDRQHGDGAQMSAPPPSTTASHASDSASTARDGGSQRHAEPSRGQDAARGCPTCRGGGEIAFNPGYPDPRSEDRVPCGECGGTGAAAPPRAVPGSRRVA
jgi:hypothetical protein